MVLELVKDSFQQKYPDDTIDLFTNQENEEKRLTYLQYELDNA